MKAHETPSGTRMMWKPRVNAIWDRAHGTGSTAANPRSVSCMVTRHSSCSRPAGPVELRLEERFEGVPIVRLPNHPEGMNGAAPAPHSLPSAHAERPPPSLGRDDRLPRARPRHRGRADPVADHRLADPLARGLGLA